MKPLPLITQFYEQAIEALKQMRRDIETGMPPAMAQACAMNSLRRLQWDKSWRPKRFDLWCKNARLAQACQIAIDYWENRQHTSPGKAELARVRQEELLILLAELNQPIEVPFDTRVSLN